MVEFDRTAEYEVAGTVDENTSITRLTFECKKRPIRTIDVGIDNRGTVTVETPSNTGDLTTPSNRSLLLLEPAKESPY